MKKTKRSAPSAPSPSSAESLDLSDSEINELSQNVTDFEGGPPRKAKAFWPSAVRLFKTFGAHPIGMALVFVMILIAVIFNVWAPNVLGDAMNVIFGGVVSAQMPEGATATQVI